MDDSSSGAWGGTTLSFERRGAELVDRESRSVWSGEGKCLSGPRSGQQLESPAYSQAYWYAWAVFFPATEIAKSDGG